MIVSQEMLDIFGLVIGDNITIQHDLLGLLPPSYDDVQTIVFDYIPNANNVPSKGQMFLIYLGFKPDTTVGEFSEFLSMRFSPQTGRIFSDVAFLMGYSQNAFVSLLLDRFFR